MKKLTLALVIVVSLLTASAVYAIDEDPPTTCDPSVVHPVAVRLDERYEEATYDQIIDWFCKGYGIGEIRLALSMAAAQDGNVVTWEDLLAAKTEDVGWGQIRIALWIAEATGERWSDVLHQQLEDGLGWGEIRQALGLIGPSRVREDGPGHVGQGDDVEGPDDESGPPPYAGPKWRGDDERPGPPPHAGPKDR